MTPRTPLLACATLGTLPLSNLDKHSRLVKKGCIARAFAASAAWPVVKVNRGYCWLRTPKRDYMVACESVEVVR